MKDGKMTALAISSTALGFVLLATHATGVGVALDKVRAAAFGHAPQDHQQQVMLEQTFPVGAGGTLVIDVRDADVRVTTAAGGQSSVTVLAEARDQDWARQVFERMRFEVGVSGTTLTVRAHDPDIRSEEWREHRGVSMTVRVAIPNRFDVRITTADGDVEVGDIEGAVQLRTSDGDVQLGNVTGSASVTTSDGDVTAGDITGGVEFRTSDGDVHVGVVSGPAIVLQSSDGDIDAGTLAAEKITVRTQDGDIVLASVAGELDAAVGDGDVTVRFAKAAPASITAGDGDIAVSADGAFGFDLDLSGGDVSVPRGMVVQGAVSSRGARGTVNGGGPLIRVRSGDGSVVVNLPGAR
jgi:DUF4097 and DUF4098 domain-containing protein YvlB